MEMNVRNQDNVLEKSRRKAFWGLQIKYTLAPVLWLYGIVFLIQTGIFLFNWFTNVADVVNGVVFLQQLQALPLAITFIVVVIGVQIILMIGFERQEKQEPAMKRVPLATETRNLIRWEYSFLVTASAFFVYFLMLCALLLLENMLAPEHAYGMSELYPAFYRFRHLYRVYPVINMSRIFCLFICIIAVSAVAPAKVKDSEDSLREKTTFAVLAGFALVSFLFYCLVEEKNPILDLVLMVIFGFSYVGAVIFSYRRRQKDDRAEIMERVE